MTDTIKMAGPFPIRIETEDGKWFSGEYFTIPEPSAGGSMGMVKVRDEKGRVKEGWLRPNSDPKAVARIILREMWLDPEGQWVSRKRPHE